MSTTDRAAPEPPALPDLTGIPWVERLRIARQYRDQLAELHALRRATALEVAAVEVADAKDAADARQRARDRDEMARTGTTPEREAERARGARWDWRLMVATVTVSVLVATPHQALFFAAQLGLHEASDLSSPGGVLRAGAVVCMTLLLEGVTWLMARLYYSSTADGTTGRAQRIYLGLQWGFAILAAGINFSHAMWPERGGGSFTFALLFGIASLMGIGAWELYMLRTKTVKSGLTAREWQQKLLRRRHFGPVVEEASRLRAVFPLTVSDEDLWRIAFLRVQGVPTLPVPVGTDVYRAFVRGAFSECREESGDSATVSSGSASAGPELDVELRDHEAEPASTVPGPGGTVAVDERPQIVEVPIDLADAGSVASLGDLLDRYWPELGGTGIHEAGTEAEPNHPTSENTPEPAARNAEPGAQHAVDVVTLEGPDDDTSLDARTRLFRSFARHEEIGTELGTLRKADLAAAIGVSERYVRRILGEYVEDSARNTSSAGGSGGSGRPSVARSEKVELD